MSSEEDLFLIGTKKQRFSITSKSYEYEFPVELLANYDIPYKGAGILNQGKQEELYKLLHWSVDRKSCIVKHGHLRVSYLCRLNSCCKGYFKADYSLSDFDRYDGVVTASETCSCPKHWVATGSNSWKIVTCLKYEETRHAFGAVMWYFASKRIVPPVFTAGGLDPSDYAELSFDRMLSSSTTFKVDYYYASDGSTKIIDSVLYASRLQKKNCALCRTYAGTEVAGSVMFGLDCSREHAVCDHCVRELFGRRDAEVPFIKGPFPLETSVSAKEKQTLCPTCKQSVSESLKVSSPGFTGVIAMVPSIFLCDYPVYSYSLFESVKDVYYDTVDWFPVALLKYRIEKKSLEQTLSYLKLSLSTAQRKCENRGSDEDEYNVWMIKKKVNDCSKRVRGIKRVLNHLGRNMKHVSFLFDSSAKLPAELIRNDREYFKEVLEKQKHESILKEEKIYL